MSDESTAPETPQQKIERLAHAVGNVLGVDKLIQMQEEQAKRLDNMLHELGNTNQNVTRIAEYLEQAAQPQTTTTGTATQMPQTLHPEPIGNMMQDPIMKAELISKLSEGLAQLINAVKGNTGQATPSPFAQLGEQMVTDLIRATVDDVQQRVYNIRKLPPPNVRSLHGPE